MSAATAFARLRRLPFFIQLVIVLALPLALVFGPYALSRIGAPAARLRVAELDGRGPGPGLATGERPLRLMTWNIAHGRGLADSNWTGEPHDVREGRLRDIAAVIAEVDPDVLVLNEVDFDSSWSGRRNQAHFLAETLHFPYVVEQRSLDFAVGPLRWAFGNAVLSRVPLHGARVIDLPAAATWEEALVGKKRGAEVSFLGPGEKLWRLAAAHLEHREEGDRVAGARRILARAQAEEAPLLVAGDLNSAPAGDPAHQRAEAGADEGENAFELLVEQGGLTPQEAGKTFPADGPRFRIDWILAPGEIRIGRAEVLETELSDHRPVVAELRPAGDAAEGGPAPTEPATDGSAGPTER